MGTAGAIIALLTALAPLVIWWLQRRQSPKPEERINDANKGLDELWDEIGKARERGDQARAEELLRAVRSRHVLAGLRPPPPPEPGLDGKRQFDLRDTASGNGHSSPSK